MHISIPYGAIKSYPRALWQNAKFFISIPYGAIKRLPIFFELSIYKQISIPYGAIKSCKKLNITAKKPKFQFLMVRLKEL